MLLWLISYACAVRATYSFLYVDHGLSQSLRFLPKGSQAWGTRLDLTVSKRPGTSYQIEIHFAVVNHLYILFSLVKTVLDKENYTTPKNLQTK